ncbi:hypothetical protein E4099_02415 [Streptomyces palmae]|uniref:Type II secretion system protein GspF domain-containing protein n=1 Tax=Streptomyces palmae TaxID=1701085 RepID=A0A4Z0HIV9_9ACTN|nr:hypothetical protein E4099_02415 [Streptomyces palmae]
MPAGAAVWLLTGRDRRLRRARLLFADGGLVGAGALKGRCRLPDAVLAVRDRWWARCGGRWGRGLWGLPAGAALAALTSSVVPLLAGAAAVPVAARWLRGRERRRHRDRRTAGVIELCGAVAGELRAGRQPNEALLAASPEGLGEHWPLVRAAARFGGDVPGALRGAARLPGSEGLTGVAACWQVAVDGGAGLASGLDRVGAALGAERDQRAQLHAQLAGARATGVVLAVLPVFVLLIGTAMGADPLRVLLHTPVGMVCLLLGGLLEWAGLAWTARLVRTAAGPEESGETEEPEETEERWPESLSTAWG